jgi:hypothetical protein
VYQKILSLTYIDDLLEGVKKDFIERFGDKVRKTSEDFVYDKEFNDILEEEEMKSMKKKEIKKPKSFNETEKAKKIQKDKPDNKPGTLLSINI